MRKELLTRPKIVALTMKAEMVKAQSGVTFDEDSEKDIDTVEIEEEDWIDYIRRSTADAIDKMERARIRCWNKTHRKMKWKLALRIATSPSERWFKKSC